MPFLNYTPLTTGIASGNVAQPSQILDNFSAIQSSINANNLEGLEQKSFRSALEAGSYIRSFRADLVTTSANALSVGSDAVILYDLALGPEQKGWPSSGSLNLSAFSAGYLWAIYPSKTYAVSNENPTNIPANAFKLGRFTNVSGLVTFSKSIALPQELRRNDYRQDQELLGKLRVWGASAFQGSVSFAAQPSGLVFQYPPRFSLLGQALWLNTTSFTVSPTAARSSDNTGNIDITATTTININNIGLNGSARTNQTGTISYINDTNVTGTGTSFLSVFQVGDVIRDAINGRGRLIVSITSDTAMVVASAWGASATGAAFARGGRAPAANTHLYAITNGSTPGYICSQRNVAGGDILVDLPVGYTLSRQLPFSFVQTGAGDVPAFLHFASSQSILLEPLQVLATGRSSTAVSLSLSIVVPSTSRSARLQAKITQDGLTNQNQTDDFNLIIRAPASSIGQYQHDLRTVFVVNNGGISGGSRGPIAFTPTSSSQAVEYLFSNNSANRSFADIFVSGYQITEVL